MHRRKEFWLAAIELVVGFGFCYFMFFPAGLAFPFLCFIVFSHTSLITHHTSHIAHHASHITLSLPLDAKKINRKRPMASPVSVVAPMIVAAFIGVMAMSIALRP